MRPRTLLGPLALATACASAPPPVEIPPAKSEPPPHDRAAVSVAVVAAPEPLVVDGDTKEWGSLAPSPSLPAPVEPRRAGDNLGDQPPPPPPPPNPADAPSRVAVALTSEGLSIAAELREAAVEGVWLGVGTLAPMLPPIGHFTRGGYVMKKDCEYEEIALAEGEWVRGPARAPEVRAACEALYARYDAVTAAHAARFVRLFRVDRAGVSAAQADGTVARIDGARAVSREVAGGVVVEATLPLGALPRMVEAPVRVLRVVAAPVAFVSPPAAFVSPPAAFVSPTAAWLASTKPWVWASLPAPVSFQPMGEERARAFAWGLGRAFFPPALSYHPALPLEVETVRHPPSGPPEAAVARTDPLYEKYASLGDVEVGWVNAFARSLAIYKAGKLVSMVALDTEDDFGSLPVDMLEQAEPRGTATRDGDLFIYRFARGQLTPQSGWVGPRWSVLAIAADGSHRDVPLDLGDAVGGFPWTEQEPFSSKTFDVLGLRGVHNTMTGSAGIEITCRWEKRTKGYACKARATTRRGAADR